MTPVSEPSACESAIVGVSLFDLNPEDLEIPDFFDILTKRLILRYLVQLAREVLLYCDWSLSVLHRAERTRFMFEYVSGDPATYPVAHGRSGQDVVIGGTRQVPPTADLEGVDACLSDVRPYSQSICGTVES